jgi:hypothetical protein
MSKTLEFMNILDSDAAVHEAYERNPQAAMAQFGSSVEEQRTLMSGDRTAIAGLAGIPAMELKLINVTNIDETYWYFGGVGIAPTAGIDSLSS